ncbi:helix-turn-helix domain-containing protein [Candidatus Woesearchaeota archaeon]|nr:helix-turn-helix domain-containing protein [Candidatus Woesearchaeota archaeon]
MPEDPFLLVSLEESESRELAKVISNKTSRRILDLLSKKDGTETQIAKDLKLPLSTVHYNLQHLLKSNLVKVDEFHYSEKGKEVNHYSLANKLIIIAPKKTTRESFMQKLKGILPVGLIALATAGVLKLMSVFKYDAAKTLAAAPSITRELVDRTVETIEEEAAIAGAGMGAEIAREGADMVAAELPKAADAFAANVSNVTQNITQNLTQTTKITETVVETIKETVFVPQPSEPNIALWFLIGAAFTIILLTIWYWFVTRKKKK